MSPQDYGFRANETTAAARSTPCIVCEDATPGYSWTDLNGEAYCLRCGTPYQLANGKLAEGESYPRINILATWIPIFRSYWQTTKRGNGSGTFLGWRDYPDQREDRQAFNAWCDQHKATEPITTA